jgi:hypothetical protein
MKVVVYAGGSQATVEERSDPSIEAIRCDRTHNELQRCCRTFRYMKPGRTHSVARRAFCSTLPVKYD